MVHSVVSTIDMVNCNNCEVQIIGKCPTLNIDKCRSRSFRTALSRSVCAVRHSLLRPDMPRLASTALIGHTAD